MSLKIKDYSKLLIIQEMACHRKVEVHLVGGYLRDLVLGKEGADFDFAVEKEALKFAQDFADRIRGAYILLDEKHGCARVARKHRGVVHTFDFADFRAPTFKEDLANRDFTINTLSVPIHSCDPKAELKDCIIDTKKALEDIQDKSIRRVSAHAFRDDPLRLMRGYSLQATLGFDIESKTLEQMTKERESIRGVSYERIRDELFKVLNSPRCGETLKAMHESRLLEVVIPQVRVMFDCPQGGYHHLPVWEHSLETVVQVEKIIAEYQSHEKIGPYLNESVAGTRTRAAVMKLACLLHDIGKPDTRKKEKDRFTFHGHENVGKGISRKIAYMLKLSTRERHILEDIVQMHLRPGYLSNYDKPSARMVFRFFRDAKDEVVSTLLMSLADQRSTCGPLTSQDAQDHHEKICLGLVDEFFTEKEKVKPVRLITGYDIIRKYKISPSPVIGKILTEIEEQQALGEIKNKTQALKRAGEILALS